MKKLKKILIALAVILSFNSKAQTVSITYVSDSGSTMGGAICSLPASLIITVYGEVTGYSPTTDSIDVHYFWDDGMDTVVRVGISSFMTDNFYAYAMHTYTSPGVYNVMAIATGPGGFADTMINSPIYITSGCTTVDGYAYYDNNSNCSFDTGDNAIGGVPLQIRDAAGNIIGYAYTDLTGFYSVTVPTGLTGLQILPAGYWMPIAVTATCPVGGIYTFNSTAASSFNFGFACTASGYDLMVFPSSTNAAAPGSDGWVSLYAGNGSCASTPSSIVLTLDPNVSYVSMNYGPAPATVVGNVLTWNTTLAGSYYWFGGFYVNVKIHTSPTATLFDTACFMLTISPTAGDLDLSNNTANFCRIIGGPYDPNSKEVSPAGMGAAGEIAPNTELTYTVNFQNTGTAPAVNVYLMDTISNNLEMSTFHIVASSHSMTPYIYEGNIVRFDYPSIMLPDSNANEALSHGWVIYKIKTKPGLANGTQIKNTGHIFFDYNPAIVTNTTLNTINIALSVAENENSLSTLIYPNPAQDQFTVEFTEEVNGLLSIVDVTGRVVKMIPVNKSKQVIVTTGELSSGLYGLSLPGVKLKHSRVQVIK